MDPEIWILCNFKCHEIMFFLFFLTIKVHKKLSELTDVWKGSNEPDFLWVCGFPTPA